MIIKLSERYRYDREKKDLKTCFISLSDIEYFEIDLFKEVIEDVAKDVENVIVNEARKFSDTEYLYRVCSVNQNY